MHVMTVHYQRCLSPETQVRIFEEPCRLIVIGHCTAAINVLEQPQYREYTLVLTSITEICL
jgi:hypothetical protein